MVLGPAILAGLIGSIIFTFILYAAPRMGMPRMDIIGMIGTMAVEPGGAARAVGAIGHLMMEPSLPSFMPCFGPAASARRPGYGS